MFNLLRFVFFLTLKKKKKIIANDTMNENELTFVGMKIKKKVKI